MNEIEVKVATVIPKDKCKLEYRSMDIENNKLYRYAGRMECNNWNI